MLHKLIHSIKNANKQFTTYHLSLLQSKSHRILKQTTSAALKRYKLSFVDWALLGLLFEKTDLRYGSLADELGVEPSFISVLVEGLQKKGLIREKKHSIDKRVKQITLTKKGKDLIPEVETYLKDKLDPILGTLPDREMHRYLELMESFVTNVKET